MEAWLSCPPIESSRENLSIYSWFIFKLKKGSIFFSLEVMKEIPSTNFVTSLERSKGTNGIYNKLIYWLGTFLLVKIWVWMFMIGNFLVLGSMTPTAFDLQIINIRISDIKILVNRQMYLFKDFLLEKYTFVDCDMAAMRLA